MQKGKITKEIAGKAVQQALREFDPILENLVLSQFRETQDIVGLFALMSVLAGALASEILIKACFFYTPEASEGWALQIFPKIFDQIRSGVMDGLEGQRKIKSKIMSMSRDELLAAAKAPGGMEAALGKFR